MSDAGETLGTVGQPDTSFDHGWFLASAGKSIGPFSASDALRIITSEAEAKPTQIWHPSFSAWRALGDMEASSDAAHPAIRVSELASIRARQTTEDETDAKFLDDFRLSNALFIACLACAIAPLFVLGAAIVRDFQDVALTSGFLLGIGSLVWWLYVEHGGVRLQNEELTFPVRVGIWPYVAWRRKSLAVAGIAGFECWTNGPFTHWVRVNTGRKPSLILFDNALHRAILRLALERQLPSLARFAAATTGA